MKKLFDNQKPVVYGIAAFVVILLILWSVKARADDLYFEAGSAVIRGETPAIGVHINWREKGPANTDYEAGFDLVGQSTNYRSNPNAIILHGALVDGYKNFEAGLGFYWHNVEWEYNCDFGFQLLARWRFTERVAVQWRHFSSAGSCKPNAGRDLLLFSWRF